MKVRKSNRNKRVIGVFKSSRQIGVRLDKMPDLEMKRQQMYNDIARDILASIPELAPFLRFL